METIFVVSFVHLFIFSSRACIKLNSTITYKYFRERDGWIYINKHFSLFCTITHLERLSYLLGETNRGISYNRYSTFMFCNTFVTFYPLVRFSIIHKVIMGFILLVGTLMQASGTSLVLLAII